MLSDELLAPLMAAVERRFGLIAGPLAETLRTALLERARGLQIGPSEYAARLSGPGADADELVDLVGRLLLGHTHFYRHGRVWEWLAAHLQDVAERAPVRALVAGCSTGEEAYTLAALLATTYGLNGFDIAAVDVNPAALQQARQGTYLLRDVSKLPRSWQDRYLEPNGDGTVRFHAALRSRVRFNCRNLIDGPPGGPYHLIMIRNVLTYMTPVATATIVDRLRRAMTRPGILVVAPHETFLVSESTGMLPAAEALPVFRNDRVGFTPGAEAEPSGDVELASVFEDVGLTPRVETEPSRGTAPDVEMIASCAAPLAEPSQSEAPTLGDHVLRPTTAVLHHGSAAWHELSDALSTLLRTRPPEVSIDLSSVLRIDNRVKQSIRAAVRFLETAGVRVEVHSGPALRPERD